MKTKKETKKTTKKRRLTKRWSYHHEHVVVAVTCLVWSVQVEQRKGTILAGVEKSDSELYDGTPPLCVFVCL